jgi:hypothetical protein
LVGAWIMAASLAMVTPIPGTSHVGLIVAIARKRRVGLSGLLRAEFGVAGPEELSLPQASRLIDGLRAAAVAR